jgi:hypothetical protein
MIRIRLFFWLLLFAACVDPRGTGSLATHSPEIAATVATDSAFAELVRQLSERGGYFDTDNLISNETSYLHVLGKMRELGVSGGAYIGVGPDQNFSYIAEVRPEIAFLIDIRRDNLLQHLMFKSLFTLSRNRMEYLCNLFARPLPDDLSGWTRRELEMLLGYIDSTPTDAVEEELALARVASQVADFGVRLTEADVATIRGIHTTFIREGLGLRFRSFGRRPRPYYPTYRQLLLETDLTGRHASYLASEGDYRFLKSLQERNLIVPVVGDLAGDHALAAIGGFLKERGLRVSAVYTSNVEFYLARAGTLDRYAENVVGLPHEANGVIIRSYFGRNFGFAHPQAVPGYYSVQLLQTLSDFGNDAADGGYRSYFDLVTRNSLDLQ